MISYSGCTNVTIRETDIRTDNLPQAPQRRAVKMSHSVTSLLRFVINLFFVGNFFK